MSEDFNWQPIQSKLAEAKSILILLAANPSLDSVAAGLGLYLAFKKQEKNVAIGAPTAMTVAFNRLVGVDKVISQIGSRNLVISFDYVKDSIEKVSYNIENNKFNLVVEPKANYLPLDSNKVSYSHTGAEADIIFIIGAAKLEDLQNFYFDNKQLFSNKLTVNIDNKRTNTRFGQVNLHDPQSASTSEIAVNLIKALNVPIDEDIATNFYAGIKANTSNFQAANVSPLTFEAAAWCLTNGARKNQVAALEQPQPGFQFPPPSYSQPLTPTNVEPVYKPVSPPPPFTQMQTQTPPENKEAKPPPDWFKPKIYSGAKPV